jgi:hypothetical protein
LSIYVTFTDVVRETYWKRNVNDTQKNKYVPSRRISALATYLEYDAEKDGAEGSQKETCCRFCN